MSSVSPERASKVAKLDDSTKSDSMSGPPGAVSKKKVAILLGYNGAGYSGMQRNPGVLTLEDRILEALTKSGMIRPDWAEDPSKMSFQRCARTDKGVSAVRQVISLKALLTPDMVQQMNCHLPPCIRVFDVRRCAKSFDSKNFCSGRTYEYILPTLAFTKLPKEPHEDYRISEETIQLVTELLRKFIGTSNFHNYTSGRLPKDPSCKRYIKNFTVGKPFLFDNMEFVIFSVTGQSFMLHQIRKMIGMVVAIVRGMCSDLKLDESFSLVKVNIPKAPGLGLILDQVHFENYNRKFRHDPSHPPLTWDELQVELDLHL